MRAMLLWAAGAACAAAARADDPPGGKAGEPERAEQLLDELTKGRPDFARAASENEAVAAFIGKSVKLADEITGLAEASAAQKDKARLQKLYLLHAGGFQLKKADLRKQYDAYAEALRKDDPKSALAGYVAGLAAMEKGGEDGPSGPAVVAFAKDFPKHPFIGDLAIGVAQHAEEGDPEAAKKTVRELLPLVDAGSPAGRQLAGILKAMEILGSAMEIAGPTLAGKEFDSKDWKGKVVLVDFWATWCGPCLRAMPDLKEAYEGFHPKGLEVVGVSLDNEQKPLEDFVKEEKLAWTQVFMKPPEDANGWSNPLATKYGVNAIPALFLIGKDGKVIAKNLHGEALRKKLTELLGPPAPTSAGKEDAAPPAKQRPKAG